MRHLSVSRLELQAAVMVERLKEQVVKAHEIKIHRSSFWSDSTSVLLDTQLQFETKCLCPIG